MTPPFIRRRSQQTMNRFTTGAARRWSRHRSRRPRRLRRWGRRWRRQAAERPATPSPIALNADAAPTGYDPLLYSQGQFQFFSALYDALFVTDAGRRGRAEPGHRVREQRREHPDHADPPGGRHLRRRLRARRRAGQGQPRPAQRRRPRGVRRPRARARRRRSPTSPRRTAQTVVITWGPPQAQRQNNLVDTAGVIVGPDGVADPDSLETAPDGSGRLHAERGRDHQGAAPTRWTRTTRRGTPTSGPTRPSSSTSSPTSRRWPTPSSPARPTSPTVLDPSTIELVESGRAPRRSAARSSASR